MWHCGGIRASRSPGSRVYLRAPPSAATAGLYVVVGDEQLPTHCSMISSRCAFFWSLCDLLLGPRRAASSALATASSNGATANSCIRTACYTRAHPPPIGCSEDEAAAMAATVRDPELQHVIGYGIGLHHAGLSHQDRRVGPNCPLSLSRSLALGTHLMFPFSLCRSLALSLSAPA